MPGYSPFWGDGLTINNSYSLLLNKMPRRNSIKRVVNRDGFRILTELFDTLIGAAAGGTALATHKRISALPGVGAYDNGIRAVETVTDINRASTAADITALKEMVFAVSARPSTYPRDLSGNGGPSYT
jgi:hypothetical protein